MRLAVISLCLAIAVPASARDLAVPAGKGWRHAETGLTLTVALDGMTRTKLTDNTANEHDVMAEFASSDGGTIASVFLFKPAVNDVALWFERAEAQIYDRKLFGDVALASAEPMVFDPPANAPGSAVRRIYSPSKSRFRSTGLAAVPLGEWLVVVRLSSASATPSVLDGQLSRILAAIRWPHAAHAAPPVMPILACATPLTFTKAKRVRSKGADTLLALMMPLAAAEKAKKADQEVAAPTRWCRDPASIAAYGVYRRQNADAGTGYMLALHDAGQIVRVTPTLDMQAGKGTGYSMTMTNVIGTTQAFDGFDQLPAPAQVYAALDGQSAGAVNGKTITLPSTFR